MENMASALKMAAAILVFIIALSVAFSIFGTTKQTADSIITMRDKQGYLDMAQMDNGVLYTSSNSISGGNIDGVNTNGDRVVNIDSVISTIYRYSKEKYGVTLIDTTGEKNDVIARFDSNTEDIMRQWYNIKSEKQTDIASQIKKNISTSYVTESAITLNLAAIYKIKIEGNSTIECGAPWYNNDEEIEKRISCELTGEKYIFENVQSFDRANGIINILKGKKIIEVINEIDKSTYLKDGSEKTNLLQEYALPTVEIVYIIQ